MGFDFDLRFDLYYLDLCSCLGRVRRKGLDLEMLGREGPERGGIEMDMAISMLISPMRAADMVRRSCC